MLQQVYGTYIPNEYSISIVGFPKVGYLSYMHFWLIFENFLYSSLHWMSLHSHQQCSKRFLWHGVAFTFFASFEFCALVFGQNNFNPWYNHLWRSSLRETWYDSCHFEAEREDDCCSNYQVISWVRYCMWQET